MQSFDWRNIDLQAFLGFIAMGILLVAAIFAFGFWYFNKDLDFGILIKIMLKIIKRNLSLYT